MVKGYHGPLWGNHLAHWVKNATDPAWVRSQIRDLVNAYQAKPAQVPESDLLRISGALNQLGINLGISKSVDVDCPEATFQMSKYPKYNCPVELEKSSSGFQAPHHQRKKHHKKRLVVLCMENDDPGIRQGYIDVIELTELDRVLREKA